MHSILRGVSIQRNRGVVILTDVLVVGLGEIGSALLEIVKGVYYAVGYDICLDGLELPVKVTVMHICFPYSEHFVRYVVDYAEKVDPDLLLIESTVLPGTTLQVSEKVRAHVVHSPVRARKASGFKWGFYNYTKFIGPVDKEGASLAEDYYKSLGFKTKVCAGPAETEFAKLLDVSYFGVMLGWNQEMRRLAKLHNLNFDDLANFLETNTVESCQRFPRPVYDGQPIGGHCIIPGIQLLQQKFKSRFLESVLESNERRQKE